MGVIGISEDRLGDIFADLSGVDVEGGRDLDVADAVSSDFIVHQSGHGLIGAYILVIRQTLHKRGGTISDANDADANRFAGGYHLHFTAPLGSTAGVGKRDFNQQVVSHPTAERRSGNVCSLPSAAVADPWHFDEEARHAVLRQLWPN